MRHKLPFTGDVTQLTSSMAAEGYQAVGLNLRFRNVSNQLLVLAYKNGTSVAFDNHGQRLTQHGANLREGLV
jgi:hypothetical protein